MRGSAALLAVLLLTSCTRMFVGLAGLHPYEQNVTQQMKDRLAERMRIDSSEYLLLAHRYAYRIEERHGKEPEKHTQAKYQPLQLRWYNAEGRSQWLVPNCDVGGFPNLKWKRFGLPDTLYPQQRSRTYADSAWTVSDDLAYMRERYSGHVPQKAEGARGHLLVYWTYFMGRQSVRLARNVERWRRQHGKGISVYYVNADSLMLGVDKPEMQ